MKPTPKILLIIFYLIWIIPGLVGRDPWMNDEPYTFGLVNHIVKTGDWTVPTLAGEPFMEKPPLYFLTAAAFTRIFSFLLEPHDAARLASGFYMLLTLLFTGLAAKEILGETYVEITILLLMGCIALQLTVHKLITDVALLTGFATAFYGLALSKRRFVLGGYLIGAGIGIGFMSKGLLAPGVIGTTALMLPVLFSSWRKKDYLFSLLIAFAAALPLLLIWPYVLYHRSPGLFNEWLWVENFGRFLGFYKDGPHHVLNGFNNLYLERLAMPILPLALWALWRHRHSWRQHPAYQLPLTAFFVMFFVLSISANARSLYTIPMLLPLSLIAAAGVDSFPCKIERVIAWSNIILFGLIAAFLWISWIGTVTGYPAFAARQLNQLQPGHTLSFSGINFGAALACTLVLLFAVIYRTRFGLPAVTNWTIGVTLVWSLVMTLWLPRLDARESYRGIFISLRESALNQYRCVASQGLGENERAMLEYYAGVLTQRIEVNGLGDCDLLLVESRSVLQNPVSEPTWQLIWEEKRPSEDPKEIFRLFKRTGQTPKPS